MLFLRKSARNCVDKWERRVLMETEKKVLKNIFTVVINAVETELTNSFLPYFWQAFLHSKGESNAL